MTLTIAERKNLDAEIARIEVSTGAQIVVASVPKSDNYPELPWIAFAGLSALAALGVALCGSLPRWGNTISPWLVVVGVLGSGAVGALAAIFLPDFARLFLRRERAEAEVRQQAQSMFLERELFVTRERRGVLLLVSVFERQVVILPDKGVRTRVPETGWAGVINAMRAPLAAGRHAEAITAGLKTLEVVLHAHGLRGDGRSVNELPNDVIETKDS